MKKCEVPFIYGLIFITLLTTVLGVIITIIILYFNGSELSISDKIIYVCLGGIIGFFCPYIYAFLGSAMIESSGDDWYDD